MATRFGLSNSLIYVMLSNKGKSVLSMKNELISQLNEKQAEAVRTVDGPLLILAGAGSGKTRVIVHRIAHLLSIGVPQSEMLAVTFTNKAAREMAQRVKAMVPKVFRQLSISTFHSFGARVLREKGELAGVRPGFSIYDAQDQASLIREIARDLGMKGDGVDLQSAAQFISALKTGRAKWSAETKRLRALHRDYQKSLRLFNAVDFDDLIMLPIEILKTNPGAREEFHRRSRHLMVDEFQDTSAAQYDLMRLLVGPEGNICVVGDDDQSIYSWRGASDANILRFERDFPRTRVIKLEQNYRSTGTILEAANALIANNRNRKAKTLWTGKAAGELIEVFAAGTELEEAEFIASKIRTLMIRESLAHQDFGVLLRANHLTRALEEVFRKENIPYVVSGGMSFFERQEVRDMLAYLKCIANHEDDTSLMRIINTPRRGIGRKLLERVSEHAQAHNCSLFSAVSALASAPDALIDEKSRLALSEFVELIGESRARFMAAAGLARSLRELVEEIDYWAHLLSENRDARDSDVVKWKFGNVESLIGSIADYEDDQDLPEHTLFDYLSRVSLASRDDLEEKDSSGRVNLMTIHSAKGLEFPVVFLAAAERDIIPHARVLREEEEAPGKSKGGSLEEERRLFYVALTRAQHRLFITHSSSRRRMGKPTESFPSPFLEELPPGCLAVQSGDVDISPEDAARLFSEARRKLFKEG